MQFYWKDNGDQVSRSSFIQSYCLILMLAICSPWRTPIKKESKLMDDICDALARSGSHAAGTRVDAIPCVFNHVYGQIK